MMSSGVGNLVKVMTGWGAAFALAAVVIVHIEDVRAALGLRLEPAEVGVVAGEAAEEPGARLSSRSALLSRGRDGHFHADASINGRTLSVLVDTGATAVVLTYEDARTAGITVSPADFRYVSSTANGQARFARTVLADVRIGDVVVRNVEAAISQPGRLATTLLGMSFLGQLRMEMKGETLVLEQ
jgi:aspartyl protease family protein